MGQNFQICRKQYGPDHILPHRVLTFVRSSMQFVLNKTLSLHIRYCKFLRMSDKFRSAYIYTYCKNIYVLVFVYMCVLNIFPNVLEATDNELWSQKLASAALVGTCNDCHFFKFFVGTLKQLSRNRKKIQPKKNNCKQKSAPLQLKIGENEC